MNASAPMLNGSPGFLFHLEMRHAREAITLTLFLSVGENVMEESTVAFESHPWPSPWESTRVLEEEELFCFLKLNQGDLIQTK